MTYFELVQALLIFNIYEPNGSLEIHNNFYIGMADRSIEERHERDLLNLGWILVDISPPYNRIHAYHWVYQR